MFAMDRTVFIMRDKECPICDRDGFSFGTRVEIEHLSIVFAVDVCIHASRPWRIALDLVEDVYDGRFVTSRHEFCKTRPAFKLKTPPYHSYHWSHLEWEFVRCSICSERHGQLNCREQFDDLFRSCVVESLKDFPSWEFCCPENNDRFNKKFTGMICVSCFLVESDKYKIALNAEIERWKKWQLEKQSEEKRVSNLRKLFSETKRLLKKPSRSQEALESLRKAYEQEATSHK